jgi:nitrate reductase NapA
LLVGVSGGRAVAVTGDPESPVNKGLCCVNGYHSVLSLYGKDRLKKALVRRDGKMVEVPIAEALDLVAFKMKETIDAQGMDSIAIYGSGQWTIPDGYVASKFMKGCVGTNNLEANARLCMASAVTGFLTSFGMDEPRSLSGHRSRGRLRALGQQHGGDPPGALLAHAGAAQRASYSPRGARGSLDSRIAA